MSFDALDEKRKAAKAAALKQESEQKQRLVYEKQSRMAEVERVHNEVVANLKGVGVLKLFVLLRQFISAAGCSDARIYSKYGYCLHDPQRDMLFNEPKKGRYSKSLDT